MGLKDSKTGQRLKAIVTRVVEADYPVIADSEEFFFDWQEEIKNEVFKIFLKDQSNNILGLLSLIDRREELRIHLNLIEVGVTNVGKRKAIENIAGSLIALACKISFDRGYNGFVSLRPKTRLIQLYQDKYLFRQYGRFLAVENESADYLIRKYLHDEEE